MSDRDPRHRRTGYQPGHYVAGGHPLPPRRDPLSSAVQLDVATEAWRASFAASRPDPLDDREDQLDDVDVAADFAVDDDDQVDQPVVASTRYEVDDELTADRVRELVARDELARAIADTAHLVEPDAAEQEVLRSAAPPADLEPANLPVWHRQLDWKSRHDPASLDYGVRALIRHPVPIVDLIRPVGPVMDQGTEGACVGFAAAAAANVLDLADGVVSHPFATADAARIYGRAKLLDHVPGEAYEGTSVLAGMLAGREAGAWDGFVWAFGTRDVAQAVLQIGPVVIGVPWLSGMYETGPHGVVRVEGKPVGGHSLVVVGMVRQLGRNEVAANDKRAARPGPWFVWQNSWGPSYGVGGLGFVHHADLAALLRSVGEAAIPVVEAKS